MARPAAQPTAPAPAAAAPRRAAADPTAPSDTATMRRRRPTSRITAVVVMPAPLAAAIAYAPRYPTRPTASPAVTARPMPMANAGYQLDRGPVKNGRDSTPT